MKAVRCMVLALACLGSLSGCKVAESYIAHDVDRLGREHSTDPVAQSKWGRYARYDSNEYEPSPAAGY